MAPGEFASDLVLVYSNKCNLRCAHCIQDSGPLEEDRLLPWRANRLVKKAAEGGIRKLFISGGEPLLFWDEVLEILRNAAGSGFHTTVVSNASWAVDPRLAWVKAQELKQAGLAELAVSTDVYHMEFVSPAAIRNALRAALKCGLRLKIKLLEDDEVERSVRELCEPLPKGTVWEDLVERIPLVPNGRARRVQEREHHAGRLQLGGLHPCVAGPSLQASPRGRVFRCCLAAQMDKITASGDPNPFFFGDADTFDLARAVKKAQGSLLFRIATEWSVSALVDLLEPGNPVRRRASLGHYEHVCQLCMDLCSLSSNLATIQSVLDVTSVREQYERRMYLAKLPALGSRRVQTGDDWRRSANLPST